MEKKRELKKTRRKIAFPKSYEEVGGEGQAKAAAPRPEKSFNCETESERREKRNASK